MQKAVDGVMVDCSPDEEAALDLEWAANTPSVSELAQVSIADIEAASPVTQRALREMMLAVGQAFPQAQQTVFYQWAAAQEAEIAPLREKMK